MWDPKEKAESIRLVEEAEAQGRITAEQRFFLKLAIENEQVNRLYDVRVAIINPQSVFPTPGTNNFSDGLIDDSLERVNRIKSEKNQNVRYFKVRADGKRIPLLDLDAANQADRTKGPKERVIVVRPNKSEEDLS
jgi:hypothetical protein